MKTIFKLIIGLVIFLVFATICLVVTGFILINMTPNKLKVGNKEVINGKTCNDLGIGDVKIKTMISDFKDIKDKKNVVTNPIDETKAITELTPTYTKLGLVTDSQINFEELFTTSISNSNTYYYEASDTSIAYILNSSIQYFTGSSETITNYKFDIAETSFYGTKKEMRVVYRVDISEFKNKLEKTIPSFVSRFLGIPKEVHLVCYYGVNVDTNGKLELTYKNIYLNDVDTPFSNAILKSVSTEDFTLEEYGALLGDAIEEAVFFLGKIGTASTNTSGEIISGSESFGMSGYSNGKISLICGN